MNDLKHSLDHLKANYFFYSILAICSAYLIFEFNRIPVWALTADEFVFARHISDYTALVPYRDFAPYKTILGYYLLSIPLFFSHALFDSMFYIKDEIALINMGCIALTAYWASRLFDKRAALFTLLAIIANQYFLIYAADLRVDMLTSWMCLFATFAVLQQQPRLGGALLGIAFLISQKALWYFVAINGALLCCWLAYSRPLFFWRTLLRFNVATAIPIIIYIVAWSFAANIHIILHNLFYEAYIQAKITWYTIIYTRCWQVVLAHGPLLFLIWPVTMLSMTDKLATNQEKQQRLFIFCCATLALFQFINYKQPFPYNFVFTIPALFLLYADFFTWLFKQQKKPEAARSIFILPIILAYSAFIVAIILSFELPALYYIITLIPILLYTYLASHDQYVRLHRYQFAIIMLLMTLAGIAFPFYSSIKASFKLSGEYQRYIIQLTDKLLQAKDDYVGGIPFLPNKDQPIPGMKNLIGPAIEYLTTQSDKLEPLLLPSLYLEKSSIDKVINDFEIYPVKLLLNNYRIELLPPKLTTYLLNHYQHYYGSIYLYAPVVTPAQLSFDLKFSGRYKIVTSAKKSLRIDGKKRRAGEIILLNKGDHTTDATSAYRLQLVPDIDPSTLNPAYRRDLWQLMIRAIIM